MKKTKIIHIRIEPDVWTWIKGLAKSKRTTVSDEARRILYDKFIDLMKVSK